MKLGVQLFGCSREFRQDPEAFFAELAKIGYTQIEPCILFDSPEESPLGKHFSGILWSPEETPSFKSLMERYGLSLRSAHVMCSDVEKRTEEMARLAAETGISAYVFNMNPAARLDPKPFAALLNRLAERLGEARCEVWLHNNRGDFTANAPFEAVLQAAPRLYSQIDTGWAMADGADPAKLLANPRLRLRGLHLKDMARGFETKTGLEVFAVLGEGVTDIPKMLASAGDVPVVIDQDVPLGDFVVNLRDSFEAVKAARAKNPYDRDGESSVLEIYDLDTGKRTVLREFDGVIEAPNWSHDGKYLVYNGEGRLFAYTLETGETREIDTAFANRCNNDHVFSPDGTRLAISHSPEGGMTSKVYTVPVAGGIPQEITPKYPSFLHGWSPDGKTLAYCAFRDMESGGDVYVIPAEGGGETRLTDAKGLNDGPEYSPDGEYIWFNSVRTGLMQAWRMKADGSEQTQMTFDEDRNTWFPHISPDGQNVVMISYRKGDLEPGQHLPGKNVELRLMQACGGEPKTLVSLYGGQGTINVNSWSPDSRKFAFVSYKRK